MATRVAVDALPASALRDFFATNEALLERISIEPDEVRHARRGEARRHFINLEYVGGDPRGLEREPSAMRRRFGRAALRRAGTLPWTIEGFYRGLQAAWRQGACGAVLHRAGYLSHYAADLSQPLHTTRYYDGAAAGDAGMHRRIEQAVQHRLPRLEAEVRRQVRLEGSEGADSWRQEMTVLATSHGLVPEVMKADRAARDSVDYDASFMAREQATIARELAASASLTASLWLEAWRQAGSPTQCSSHAPSGAAF